MERLMWRCVGAVAALVGLAAVGGCGSKRVVFDSSGSSALDGDGQRVILLAAPLDSLDLSVVRDALLRKYKEPGRAMTRVRCILGRGLPQLVRGVGPGTELRSDLMAELPLLPPTPTWLRATRDALGVPHFTLTDSTVLGVAAGQGIDAVIVPLNLSPSQRLRSGTVGFFGPSMVATPTKMESLVETPVALVDTRSRVVAWSGVVTSGSRNFLIGETDFEREMYDWTIDLLGALGRKVRQPGVGEGVRGMGKLDCR